MNLQFIMAHFAPSTCYSAPAKLLLRLVGVALRFFTAAFSALYTLLPFTKSDFKTIIIPVVGPVSASVICPIDKVSQSFFAVASAPLSEVSRLLQVVFWI